MKTRCAWAKPGNELYLTYHDEEWGRAVHDDTVLFEFLVLEGAQAGLSWETILKKRENYRQAFDDFDYVKIAEYSENKIQELLENSGIIRNKLKVRSAVKNAKVFLKIRSEFGSFSKYLWDFVGGKQIVNTPKDASEVPVSTELSDRISQDLKRRGMSFVGTTIIYAYLQAVGVVNDHVVECFCKNIKK
ncbi:DNA-3-methyladenine glycosylase I [Candidatus Gracilibacteria bacterium]|nr:DNA-3-methyladenine glycosylase I [Candidatus Gracilibacteria bacterium]